MAQEEEAESISGIKAASVLSPSLTGLAHTGSPAPGKGLTNQPLSANTSLSYLGEAGSVGMASHLTPSPGCQNQKIEENIEIKKIAKNAIY